MFNIENYLKFRRKSKESFVIHITKSISLYYIISSFLSIKHLISGDH